MSVVRNLSRLLRVRQWVKNSFILIGPFFGKAWGDPGIVLAVLAATAGFCLISSGVYIFNDWFDREHDRRHPHKRARPLASGAVSPAAAFALAFLLFAAGAWIGAAVSARLLLIFAAYVAMNFVYSAWAKHVVVLDVFVIAMGFFLRILAGTSGVGIPPSKWLLLCGLMLALFFGFVKRYSELKNSPESAPAQRRVLLHYSDGLLTQAMVITAATIINTYSLYTMDPQTVRFHGTERLLYTVPFVLFCLLRYIFLVENHGKGTDPFTDFLNDAPLILGFLGWLGVTVCVIKL